MHSKFGGFSDFMIFNMVSQSIILLYRDEKIQRLCRVVGNDFPQDPDEAYELTTDNAKKMMAIFMRFRYVHVFVPDLNTCRSYIFH